MRYPSGTAPTTLRWTRDTRARGNGKKKAISTSELLERVLFIAGSALVMGSLLMALLPLETINMPSSWFVTETFSLSTQLSRPIFEVQEAKAQKFCELPKWNWNTDFSELCKDGTLGSSTPPTLNIERFGKKHVVTAECTASTPTVLTRTGAVGGNFDKRNSRSTDNKVLRVEVKPTDVWAVARCGTASNGSGTEISVLHFDQTSTTSSNPPTLPDMAVSPRVSNPFVDDVVVFNINGLGRTQFAAEFPNTLALLRQHQFHPGIKASTTKVSSQRLMRGIEFMRFSAASPDHFSHGAAVFAGLNPVKAWLHSAGIGQNVQAQYNRTNSSDSKGMGQESDKLGGTSWVWDRFADAGFATMFADGRCHPRRQGLEYMYRSGLNNRSTKTLMASQGLPCGIRDLLGRHRGCTAGGTLHSHCHTTLAGHRSTMHQLQSFLEKHQTTKTRRLAVVTLGDPPCEDGIDKVRIHPSGADVFLREQLEALGLGVGARPSHSERRRKRRHFHTDSRNSNTNLPLQLAKNAAVVITSDLGSGGGGPGAAAHSTQLLLWVLLSHEIANTEPEAIESLWSNSHRLVGPSDLYMTLTTMLDGFPVSSPINGQIPCHGQRRGRALQFPVAEATGCRAVGLGSDTCACGWVDTCRGERRLGSDSSTVSASTSDSFSNSHNFASAVAAFIEAKITSYAISVGRLKCMIPRAGDLAVVRCPVPAALYGFNGTSPFKIDLSHSSRAQFTATGFMQAGEIHVSTVELSGPLADAWPLPCVDKFGKELSRFLNPLCICDRGTLGN